MMIASNLLGAVVVEEDGWVAVEAEAFVAQEADSVRAWRRVSADSEPFTGADPDPAHWEGASGGAYLELLPDTRVTHADRLLRGENFSPNSGEMALLHYDVNFANAGRYYIWVRAFSTGSEDNGIHVGLNGEWPESGSRMQWCQGKQTWRWESKQRTEANHCGEPYKIFLDIPSAGIHRISFSMREDGFEFDKWLMTMDREFERPEDHGPRSEVNWGSGTVTRRGESRVWHRIDLELDGPFARETDAHPNPFTDYRFDVRFTHSDGTSYLAPGYFAADGRAADTSADAGSIWRASFAPDRVGRWSYRVEFRQGPLVAVGQVEGTPVPALDGITGSFEVDPSDKSGRDLRGKGRLSYVGERYLRFEGSGDYFLKAGADAPETFLGYADFDGTQARKKNVPLKTWEPHLQDWREGDPTWGEGKGKGMIGAINYLASQGMNVFSFLTYNAGGDGDNVWPYVDRDDPLRFDCSKLDQWGVVFDHATRIGHYLHFKLQETENDDQRRGGGGSQSASVPTALDGGRLGVERMLYLRELVARFGHALALNWNLGEENTQSTEEQQAMIDYLRAVDPYDHSVVVHTYPEQQDKVYEPLLGSQSQLTGVSLQNSHIRDTHWQTVKWVRASEAAGKPWVVAFDESGSAAHGQVPDWGYQGFEGVDRAGNAIYDHHAVRRQTLWGALMGGGAGVEYYFGYQLPENDLICEDWRSREASWQDCRRALAFFQEFDVPFWELAPADALVGNPEHTNAVYALAGEDHAVVYLPNGGTATLNTEDYAGKTLAIRWYNPRRGGLLQRGSLATINGGPGGQTLGSAPQDPEEDWVILLTVE